MSKEMSKFTEVFADDEVIRFTDESGRTGEITEYGAVYDEDVDPKLPMTHEEGSESTFDGHRNPIKQAISDLPAEDRLSLDLVRRATGVYGKRGQVPKSKK